MELLLFNPPSNLVKQRNKFTLGHPPHSHPSLSPRPFSLSHKNLRFFAERKETDFSYIFG